MPTRLAGADISETLYFEPNYGQARGGTTYVARNGSGAILVQQDAIILRSSGGPDLTITFAGASPHRWAAAESVRGTTSYYLGRVTEYAIAPVPHFARLRQHNLYPGIDITLYGRHGRLEYDLELAPYSDPHQIRLAFLGAHRIALNADGDIVAESDGRNVVQHKPLLYQRGPDGTLLRVPGRYVLEKGNHVGIAVDHYDPGLPLVIDPAIESTVTFGGSGESRMIYVDSKLAIGSTTSLDLASLTGTTGAGRNVYVRDLKTNDTAIIGGSGDDIAMCAAMDPYHGYVIGGYTNSRDLPVKGYPSPLQSGYGGGAWDGFIISIGPGSLQPSMVTYWGGSGDDRVLGIAYNDAQFAAVGTTTSSDFPTAEPWQALGGSIDGFLMVYDPVSASLLSTYLGGAGDDRALAVIPDRSGGWYVCGDTSSAEWRPAKVWSGTLTGAADGYLLHAVVKAPGILPLAASGLLIGGNGYDSVNALGLLSNGTVAVGGTTASTNLKFASALQQQYGGSISDAYVAWYSADLSTRIAGSLVGGSARDEGLALAVSASDETMLGGVTASGDFPLLNGLESACGRGAEDGFVTVFDSSFQPMISTCYGGAGADRITALSFDSNRIVIGGNSDSADLPSAARTDTSGSGTVFMTALTLPVIHATAAVVGKDLAGMLTARLGDSSRLYGVPLTVKSSDPSRVLVAVQPDDPGQSEVTTSAGDTGDPAARIFRAYCLSAEGSVSLQLSAPGYPDGQVQVRCAPAVLYVSSKAIGTSSTITVTTAVVDPGSGKLVQQIPRGGLNPIQLYASGDPADSVTLDRNSSSLDSLPANGYPPPGVFTATWKSGRDAGVALWSDSGLRFVPSSRVSINKQALSLSLRQFGRGLAIPVGVYSTNPSPSMTVTLASSDPSRVRFSNGTLAAGQDTLTVLLTNGTMSTPVWLRLLADGPEVIVTATASDGDVVSKPLRVTRIGASITGLDLRNTLNLSLGESLNAVAKIFLNPSDGAELAGVAPPVIDPLGPLAGVTIRGNNPQVASPETLAGNWPAAVTFPVQGIATGSSVFSFVGLPDWMTTSSLTVSVALPHLSVASERTGFNLVSQVVVSRTDPPQSGNWTLHLESVDPSRLLLSTSQTSAGSAAIDVVTSQKNVYVYAHGLASSGTADVIASTSGLPAMRSAVALVPSGFAWSSTTGGSDLSGSLKVAALDPADMTPISWQQPVRPGVSPLIKLDNANPEIVNSPAQVSWNALISVQFQAVAAGDAYIRVVPPDGYEIPAASGSLHLTVRKASVAFSLPIGIGSHLQAPAKIGLSSSYQVPAPTITLTSTDPGRLRLSTTYDTPGKDAVTLTPQQGQYANFWVQAVGEPADVLLRASGDGLDDATVVLTITPTALAIGYGSTLSSSVVTGMQSGPVSLVVAPQKYPAGYADTGVTFEPSFSATSLQVEISDPSIAKIVEAPVLRPQAVSAEFTVQPLAPGEAVLRVLPPPGFVSPLPSARRSVTMSVKAPLLVLPSVSLGRNLQLPLEVIAKYLDGNVMDDVDVSLISDDPARLIISDSASAAGSGVLTFRWRRGDRATHTVYLQALADAGTVPVRVSATGYGSATANVLLYSSTLRANSNVSITLGQPNSLSLLPVPSIDVPGGYKFSVRPGFSGNVGVRSSDSAIFTVPSPVIPVVAGAQEFTVPLQAVSSGTANLMFTTTEGVGPISDIPVRVSGRMFFMVSTMTLGKDLETKIECYGDRFGESPLRIVLTSSDPSRLLVSNSPDVPGQATVSIDVQPGQQPRAWLQALAGEGSVQVTSKAPGYQDAFWPVLLSPAAVAVERDPRFRDPISPLSGPVPIQVRLTAADNSFSFAEQLRPGAAPIQVPVTLSDPTIGKLSATSVTFRAGDAVQTVAFQATGVGPTEFSAGVPAGYTDAGFYRRVTLTGVAFAVGSWKPLRVGKELTENYFLNLSATTWDAVTLTLTSTDPSRLLLATNSLERPTASITVPLTAFNNPSIQLAGVGSPGIVPIKVSHPRIPDTFFDVAVWPSGFILAVDPVTLSYQEEAWMPMLSVMLDPQSLEPVLLMNIREGRELVIVSFASSDPSVVPTPQTLGVGAGGWGAYVTAVGKASGTATVSIKTPDGFYTPSRYSSVDVTVR